MNPEGEPVNDKSARRIENRRRIIASLRSAADTAEATARELREKADHLEASTDALVRDQ